VLLAFVLGTFDRIELTQNERGKLRLTRTWRVCFAERQPVRIYLRTTKGHYRHGQRSRRVGLADAVSAVAVRPLARLFCGGIT